MKRRHLIKWILWLPVGYFATALAQKGAAKISAKDILKEGQPATIINYCEKPEKQPNKFCPDWKEKPGHCDTCQFYLTGTKAEFKGAEYAKCQLLSDPNKAQYVQAKAWCQQYVKKSS